MPRVKMAAATTDNIVQLSHLPPAPDALAEWEKLPQNEPSNHALPPMTGGIRESIGLLIVFAALILLGLLLQGHLP
jgi:hypothetical protein